MNLFICDVPIRLYPLSSKLKKINYDCIINADNQAMTKIIPHRRTWIKNATDKSIKNVLDSIYAKKAPLKTLSIDISTQDYKATKKFIKKQFDIIVCAAGGVVYKQNQLLLINRLKKWDLPKGKKENKETYAWAASREIKEECNIDVLLEKKICITWHSYNRGNDKLLKQTHWYLAALIDDTNMKPCLEENIEEVRWMHQKEAQQALKKSYQSIRFVLKKYYNQAKDEARSPF